ncbi:MAG TPA: universal stress protein [Gammaproteobacteria bacterium]|nr:universal stress protein [Gammaproteobacteria bacterium]
MYRKILVGLDGSTHSLRAATTGIRLASQFDAELHLLTVTRPFKVTPELRRYLEAENLLGEPKYVLDEMTNAITSKAKALADEANLKKVKTEVREGRPARTIVDYAKSSGVDLIVLGSRGAGESETLLLGSVSQKVSMLSECTVMIVR